MGMSEWDCCVEEALAKLGLLQLLRSLRPITPSLEKLNPFNDVVSTEAKEDCEFKVFDEMQPWDRASVEVEIAEATVQKWLLDIPSSVTVGPKVIKEEFIEKSNQSDRDDNDITNNADSIATPANISCIEAKDSLSFLIREGKVKVLMPREAGYAIQLFDKTLLDVRPSTEHKKLGCMNGFDKAPLFCMEM